MKFEKISSKEKEEIIAKMINYVKSKVNYDDATNMDLYYACKTAGLTFYEFMQDYIKKEP